MGRGGFPPSETGSFSAHHTAQWVGLSLSSQLSVLSSQENRFNLALACLGRGPSVFAFRLYNQK